MSLTATLPKFDIRETGDHYELHGELPGVNREQVEIEFTELQTMVVRGRVERSYTAGTPPAGLLEDAPATRATEGNENQKGSPHQATVEDDQDAAKGSSTMVKKAPHKADKQSPDTAKYWLSERSVGEFSRVFSFPSGIDQDAVTASFKDGILGIAVPKARRHGSRRIAIN
ncbi:hypothetical protein RJ55_06824 [Drechmeria coniospora]|nr:hypothetical protein RJ55_06824 [Drechmeria coniospora]